MAKKYDFDDSDGVWRTVGGRRIFIKNGQDLASAMVESGKFKNLRSNYKKAKEKDEKEKQDKEWKEKVEKLEKENAKNKGYELESTDKQKEAEVWEKQPDGTFLANKDAMKKQYEENHKNYDAKIKQFAEDRKNMTNGDWEGMLMAYEQQNADGTYKTLQDIMDDVDKYEKGNIRIEDNNGELTGYTNGERIEYAHSGSTGLMANVYSTDDGKLNGQQFEIPKEYQGDKLKDYSLKEIERLKSDKEAYDTRQKEGLDKFIQKSTNPFYPDNEYSKEDLDRMAENGIKPMDNSYSGRGWKGVNSDKHLSTSEQAKAITSAMKEKYSDVKISRKSDVYSGGSSIDFNIMSSDKDMYISDSDIDKLGDEQLFNTDITRGYGFERWANDNIDNYKTDHTYSVDDVKKYAKETLNNIKSHENQNVRGNEWYLSDYGKKVVSDLNKEANSYTYDDSDAMTDYFNHGTYMNVSIGKWDKPYQVNQKSNNETMNTAIREKASKNNTSSNYEQSNNLSKEFWNKYSKLQSEKQFNKKVELNRELNKWKEDNNIRLENNGNEYKLYKGDEQISYLAVNNSIPEDIKNGKYLRAEQLEVNKKNGNQISNSLREKAYQKYLKEHPASKMTFEEFKDMRK